MKVKEVMSPEPKTIKPDNTILKAAKMMNKYRIGCLIVEKGWEVTGIITERDILKAFATGKKAATKVMDVMTKGVVTADYNDTLEEAAQKMLDYGVKHLPVLRKGRCVGIVTATDLITYEERLIDKISELFLLPRKNIEGQ